MPGTVDPFVGVWFDVDFGDHLKGAFFECKGFGSSSGVNEIQQNNAKGLRLVQKIPGVLTWTDITLSRGITDSMELWKWLKEIDDGGIDKARANGTITLLDHTAKAIAKFEFTNAWPISVTGPALSSDSNDYGVEELVITHEGYKRVKV
ncbi:MAG: phage tail protein [Thermomicrobia bacterium]|nr:phage tail protein [Thermomicrobia bacterium]